MDRKQKEPYNQMAALDKNRYDKQLLEFTHALDHNQIQEGENEDEECSECEEGDYSQNFSNQFTRSEYPSSRKESATKDTTLNFT